MSGSCFAEIEAWFEADAESWARLMLVDFQALAATWETRYRAYIERRPRCVTGERAVYSLSQRLPSDLVILSGIQVSQHANAGGAGRAAFRAQKLRRIDRELANRLELIVSATDFSWTCVFTHEGGGGYAYETLYDLG